MSMDDNKTNPAKDRQKLTDDLLKNILGNAVQTTIQYEQQSAASDAKKCSQCNAARPADTDLKVCDYCGHQF
jgi:hypothetical protein